MARQSIYSYIKERVTTREAAEYYGHKANRQGMIRCPFHYDKAPSMKVDENYICFGCGEKGDVIAFVSKLFGLTSYEAAQKIAADIGISLPEKNKAKGAAGPIRHVSRVQMDRKRFEQAIDRAYNVYCEYLHLLRSWEREHAPKTPAEDFHPLYVEACQQIEPVEIILDLLLYGSHEEKAFVLIEKGKGVNILEKRIIELKSGASKPA